MSRPHPPAAEPPHAVVFDFGGVLTEPVSNSITAWLQRERIHQQGFTDLMREWMGRHSASDSPVRLLEEGKLPVPDFEHTMAGRLVTTDGAAVAPEGLLDRFFADLRMDQRMVELVRAVSAAGCATALLSNSWGDRYPHALLTELFPVVVISEQVGLSKPDPEIYDLTLRRLGLPAHRTVFIDDSSRNIVAASTLGMHTVQHRDPEDTSATLRGLIPELAGAGGQEHRT